MIKTLEELEQKRPARITVVEASTIMNTDPQMLRIALQQERFPFGVAVKNKRWSYYINTERFIKYMRAID